MAYFIVVLFPCLKLLLMKNSALLTWRNETKQSKTNIKRNPPPTKTQLLLSVLWKLCDGLNAVSSAFYKVHTKWDWSHSFQPPKKCQLTRPSSACLLITSPLFGYKNLVQNCIDLLPSAHSLLQLTWLFAPHRKQSMRRPFASVSFRPWVPSHTGPLPFGRGPREWFIWMVCTPALASGFLFPFH